MRGARTPRMAAFIIGYLADVEELKPGRSLCEILTEVGSNAGLTRGTLESNTLVVWQHQSYGLGNMLGLFPGVTGEDNGRAQAPARVRG